MLGILDFTGSEHWATLQFTLEYSLKRIKIYPTLSSRTANQGHIFPVSRQLEHVRTCVLCCILAVDKECKYIDFITSCAKGLLL